MRRAEILQGIERLGPWFHCVELAPGLTTKTASHSGEPPDHPRPTWNVIKRCLPEDLSGMSVLDVGCNAGFYCVEAKRRNASRVLGVDSQRKEIAQARFVARVLGLDLEYRRLSVYELDADAVGRFDITLALGLIYHLKHLVRALERLFDVTGDTLIVETAILPRKRGARPTAYRVGDLERTLYPLGWVDNPPEAPEAVYNWFIPSIDAAVALLRNVGFAEVGVASVEGDRAVVVCRRSSSDESRTGRIGALLEIDEREITCHPGADIRWRVRAQNRGSIVWRASGEKGTDRGRVRLGAHLLDPASDDVVIWDYGRADLEEDVAPGGTTSIEIEVRAPGRPGTYEVEFDMVAEQLTWFEDHGSPVVARRLRVVADREGPQ
jgi:tRNA (mo5U34)-methyltransferase